MTKALYLLTLATLMLGACSMNNQVAQLQSDRNDDVYFSDVSAGVLVVAAKNSKQSAQSQYNEDLIQQHIYDNYYNYRRHMSAGMRYQDPWMWNYYTSRINPWFSPSLHFNLNRWSSPYDYYGYGFGNDWVYSYPMYNYRYGYPYRGSLYGGPVSYNTYYPGYNYGAYTPGYVTVKDPNYRARPMRGNENISGLNTAGTIRMDGQGRMMTSRNRGEEYERTNANVSSGGRSTSTASGERARPSRAAADNTTRTPARVSAPPRSEPYNPPAISYGGNRANDNLSSGSSSGSSSSGSSDDGSRARPSRAGD